LTARALSPVGSYKYAFTVAGERPRRSTICAIDRPLRLAVVVREGVRTAALEHTVVRGLS